MRGLMADLVVLNRPNRGNFAIDFENKLSSCDPLPIVTTRGSGRFRGGLHKGPSLTPNRKRTTENTPSIVVDDLVSEIDGAGIPRHLLLQESSRGPVMELELRVERKKLRYRYGRK